MTEMPMEWQPIETAPRDGTPIIVLFAGNEPFVSLASSVPLIDRPGGSEIGRCWINEEGMSLNEPTHWIPFELPKR